MAPNPLHRFSRHRLCCLLASVVLSIALSGCQDLQPELEDLRRENASLTEQAERIRSELSQARLQLRRAKKDQLNNEDTPKENTLEESFEDTLEGAVSSDEVEEPTSVGELLQSLSERDREIDRLSLRLDEAKEDLDRCKKAGERAVKELNRCRKRY